MQKGGLMGSTDPIEERAHTQRRPAHLRLLAAQLGDHVCFLAYLGRHLPDHGVGGIHAVLGGQEPFHAGFGGGVDNGILLIVVECCNGRDDGVDAGQDG